VAEPHLEYICNDDKFFYAGASPDWWGRRRKWRNCVRNSPYYGNLTDSHPQSSRLQLLANALDAGSNRPMQRAVVYLIVMFVPVLAAVIAAEILAVAR
jgi:hypothetical protein